MNSALAALFGGLRLARPESVTDTLFEELERKRKREEEEREASADDDAEEEGEEEEPELEEQDVKLLVLDFDGTMTLTIVPRSGNRPPMENVTSDRAKLFTETMTKQNHIDNFGGKEVVAMWEDLFDELLEIDVELRILSYGLKAPIVHALEQVGLINYFTSADGEKGDLVWAKDTPPLLNDDTAHKAYVIGTWMDDFNGGKLWSGEVAFVDDDPNMIDAPLSGADNQGVAQILATGHARRHQPGFYEDTMQWIRDICGLTAPDQ
jgi:hypothetical protein